MPLPSVRLAMVLFRNQVGRRMSNDQLREHLKGEVERYLKLYDGKRQKNKFLALSIKLVSAFFAASITVILGIEFTDKSVQLFSNIALGLSAFITVLNTWDAFFNHKALWYQFNNAAISMRLLKADLNYAIIKNDGEIDDGLAEKIHNRLKTIIVTTNEEWQELRRDAERELQEIEATKPAK